MITPAIVSYTAERNPGQQPTSLPMANTSLAQPGGLCGPAVNAKCSDKQCCSSSHYCGVTTGHCVGANCLAGWGRCGPGEAQQACRCIVYNGSCRKPQALPVAAGLDLAVAAAAVKVDEQQQQCWHWRRIF